jgi:hypothetical protein
MMLIAAIAIVNVAKTTTTGSLKTTAKTHL